MQKTLSQKYLKDYSQMQCSIQTKKETKDKVSLEFFCGQCGLVGQALSYKAEGQ